MFVKWDQMWELFNKCKAVSLRRPPGEEPPTNLQNLCPTKRSFFCLGTKPFPETLRWHAEKATSRSVIINSRRQVGTRASRPRLTFFLAYTGSANVSADSQLTSATWEKWPRGIHWVAVSVWLYENQHYWLWTGNERYLQRICGEKPFTPLS